MLRVSPILTLGWLWAYWKACLQGGGDALILFRIFTTDCLSAAVLASPPEEVELLPGEDCEAAVWSASLIGRCRLAAPWLLWAERLSLLNEFNIRACQSHVHFLLVKYSLNCSA